MRLLFIGNSFTSRSDLPRMIAELASQCEEPLIVETRMITAGGASLRRHWNASVAREAIESKSWDYVVLQEQSTLPLKNPARYHENVRLFDPVIRAHGAATALYLTWSRANALEKQDALMMRSRPSDARSARGSCRPGAHGTRRCGAIRRLRCMQMMAAIPRLPERISRLASFLLRC